MVVTTDIVPVLQLAVSPVILISAVGLILLTMNNRMAASISRARLLARESETATGDAYTKIQAEIAVIYRRANLIRRSIVLTIASALASSVLIISLFMAALFGLEVTWLYGVCFMTALGCLILGLIFFIQEVNDGLVALRMEIGEKE